QDAVDPLGTVSQIVEGLPEQRQAFLRPVAGVDERQAVSVIQQIHVDVPGTALQGQRDARYPIFHMTLRHSEKIEKTGRPAIPRNKPVREAVARPPPRRNRKESMQTA